MALSGVFYGTTSNQYVKPKIEWRAEQNIEGNYSEVTAVLSYSRTNTGYKTESTWYGSITIDGQTLDGSVFATVTYNSNTVVLTFEKVRVDHDGDGFRDVTISADGYFYNTKTYNTVISAVVTLDQIPRAAKAKATDANVNAVSTVTVTGLGTGYTYTLGVKFGSLTGYLNGAGDLLDGSVQLTNTTIPFTIPIRFCYEITDSPSGVCTLECTTYLDGEQIGETQTSAFTVTAAKDFCDPVVSGTVEDINETTLALTGDKTRLVRYASTAKCTISAQARYFASIREKQIGGVTVAGDTLQIQKVESSLILFRAVDSRGYDSTAQVQSDMVPYIPLTLNAAVTRTDPTSGNAVLEVRGNCYYGSFGAAENSLRLLYRVNGGEEQSLSLEIFQDSTYAARVALSGLDYESSHKVTVWVADAASESEQKTASVGKGIPVFDWGEEDFSFHVPVNAEGGLLVEGKALVDLIYPVGSIYMSVNEADPAALFGGTWERIRDRFLLAAGDTYENGAVGGEGEHTLTVEEMPSHTHASQGYAYAGGSGAYTVLATNGNDTDKTTLPTGGGQPFSIMPPYLAVNMWQRTA